MYYGTAESGTATSHGDMKTNASDAGHEEVVSALAAATVCQSYVQHADTKAAIFIVVHAGHLGASCGATPRAPVEFEVTRGID